MSIGTAHSYVSVRPRPCKIAFLIDPSNCPSELLDAIFEFNIEHWGGRYNPTIPVINSQISDGYWNLLQLSDPDVIYSYVKIEESLIKEIDKEISPFHFVYHQDHGTSRGMKPAYRVTIYDQIKTRSFYKMFNERFLYPFTSPVLLVYYNKCKDHYIQRNFGAIDDSILPNRLPSNVKTLRFVGDYTFGKILHEVAETRELMTPIQLSVINIDPYEPEYSPTNEYFTVIVGDNVWDWLYFWNREIILPRGRIPRILQLCVPPSIFDSVELKNSLGKFLERKFWNSGPSHPTVLFASNEIEEGQLKKLGQEITKKNNHFCKVQILEENAFPPVKIGYTDFDLPESVNRFPLIAQHSGFQNVYPPSLEGELSDEKWMLDLKIDYRPERFTYTNITYWWKLPKHLGITSLFIKTANGRITNSGMISIETSGKKEYMELNIPDDFSVLYPYLIDYNVPSYTDDIRKVYLEKKMKTNIKKEFRISDKGGYTRGVMRMFPSLWHTGEFVDNRYWRKILETLCNISPETKERFIEPIINKIDKIDVKIWKGLVSNSKEAKRWLAERVLKIAREQQVIKAKISFDKLLRILNEEREEFRKMNKRHEEFDTSEEENKKDLLESLNRLVSSGMFEQGIGVRCYFCGSSFWYSIEELRKEISCKGCQAPIQVSAEAKWVYKLNELLKNVISFHGVFPVIWALGELLHRARDSFVYLPSLGLYKNYEAPFPYAEIDIACILDGKLIIGEIKTSSHEFSKAEIDKFSKTCKEILPQKAIIGAFWGKKDYLTKLSKRIEKDLKPFGIEVEAICPHTQVFDPVYHI